MEEEMMYASSEAFDYVMRDGMKQYEKFKPEYDQAMLRWYIYGSVEEVDPCDIYERCTARETYRKKFPRVFVHALITHLMDCEVCREKYLSDNPVPEVSLT